MTPPPRLPTNVVPPAAMRTTGPRPRVHGEVIALLGRKILSGEIAAGASLATNTTLSVELGVSRSALREVVRVLAAKGLVEMRPRSGTRVQAQQHWHLLDPQVLGWCGASLDRSLVQYLLECRQLIEPGAAAAAAQRATPAQLAQIEDAYGRMVAALPHDVEACCQADLDFHVGILRATENPFLIQLAGTISAALMTIFRLSTGLAASHQAALSAHRDVIDRIRLRDGAGAAAAMSGLLGIARHDLDVTVLAGTRYGQTRNS